MARVSIRSPRSSMPTSSYPGRPASGRRGSITTYTDHYSSGSGYSSPIRTGASRDSFTHAAGRFNTTSSSYGSSYTSASKPPLYRSRITSPSPARSTHTTTSRALPKGPGPRDQYGTQITAAEARGTFRKSRTETPTRSIPLKADHSHSSSNGYSSHSSVGKSYSPSNYTSSTYTSPRLGREKRTNSISDLTSSVESMGVSSRPSLSRKYGSTTDINGNVDNYSSSSSVNDFKKTHTTTTTLNGYHRGSSSDVSAAALPDINDRPNSATSTSRSPSMDRVTRKNNTLNNNYNTATTSSSRQRVSSPEHGGLVGLRNVGNTCFMNSIIQCLSHTKQLRQYMLRGLYLDELNTTTSSMKGALAKSFAKLLDMLWSKSANSSVSPTDFKEKISKFAPRFIGYSQQDAQEFLIYLLEGLHEDLNRHRKKKKRVIDCDTGVVTTPATQLAEHAWGNYLEVDDSFIGDLFIGQLRSALTCTVCDYTSNTFDVFMDLSLPVRKKYSGSSISLDECFRLFTQEEVLDGDERPRCAKCNKNQRCTKRFSIQRFPDVLIIHLKRFSQDSGSLRSKINCLVDYPLRDLDLTEYAAESFAPSSTRSTPARSFSNCNGDSSFYRSGSRRERYMYNLFAVSCHHGTPFGGHYYAYANTSGSTWHEFNDQSVSSQQASSVVSQYGYVLFYQRTTT